ncbi:biopolymer transporter ExbB [Xinfangfangia sp. D13-10-4-6]|uniref:biopolymer transporter ExbB n=1 Tax=Pseudogemmobacter hezensis TaxID=2737662 RepID=UPI001553B677|nr:biopolymer transporter ExbB [Pseudogemmobacter hezensis]NPD14442.1 biopolymer transporter ExbB [Pseudogemmobacter hezensis]
MQRPEAATGAANGAANGTTFSQPIRAIVTMLIVCVLVAVGLWFMHKRLEDIMLINPWLNGMIAFVFGLGVVTCFWQLWILAQSVSWIERYVRQSRDQNPEIDRQSPPDEAEAPLLLAPLATLLKSRSGRGLAISSASGRSILDSVAQRVDEARDITRYLINLLVFLGLLGTFWGLATTVPAVVETIRSLEPAEGESGLAVFGKLMQGLEGQLGGMGTAFSSSLLGLGGSLVLGLLELFAGHGQNRFYRELEEWLSSITRIGLADGETGQDQSLLLQALDQMTGQMADLSARQNREFQTALAQMQAQNTEAQGALAAHLIGLTTAVDRIATGLDARLAAGEQASQHSAATLSRLADSQEQLLAFLAKAQKPGQPAAEDPESRMRLRSIDVQMLRILEEISAGRQETLADLRHDLAQLTLAVRQLTRQPSAGTPPGR